MSRRKKLPRDDKQLSQRHIEDNTRVIEWTTQIYGIFWGIWVGYSINAMVEKWNPLANISDVDPVVRAVLIGALPVGLSLLMSIYVFWLIRWLWSMRFILRNSGYPGVFGKLGKAFLFWVVLTLAVVLLQFILQIGWPWVWMGIWSTLGWIGTTCGVVLVDRRGWR